MHYYFAIIDVTPASNSVAGSPSVYQCRSYVFSVDGICLLILLIVSSVYFFKKTSNFSKLALQAYQTASNH